MTDPLPSAAGSDADLGAVIRSGADDLHIPLQADQVDRLVAYLRLIERWNATYNLTAIRDPLAMATQHIVDSLTVVPTMRRLLADRDLGNVLDVGSGAGLPGVVVAIVAPEVGVTCVDSVGKKAAFIAQVAASLALGNLRAIHARVEAIRAPPRFEIIVSRAFASLFDFVSSTRHLLQPRGRWVAMKGKTPVEELAAVSALSVEFEVQPVRVPRLDAERCLLVGHSTESEHSL